MRQRERVVYAVVLPVLALVAAWALFVLPGGDPEPEPSPSPTMAEPSPSVSPTVTATPTVSEEPTPTFTPTERFTPEVLPTGEDFQQVLQTIFDIRHEAFNRRDVGILGQIYGTKCECLTIERQAIEALVDEGVMFVGAAPEVYDVSVTQRADDDAAVLVFRVRFAGSQRIDDVSGEVVREFELGEVRFEMGLLRGFGPFDDGRWLVVAAQTLTDDA